MISYGSYHFFGLCLCFNASHFLLVGGFILVLYFLKLILLCRVLTMALMNRFGQVLREGH